MLELGPSVRMFYGFALMIVLTVAQLKGLFRIIMIKNNLTLSFLSLLMRLVGVKGPPEEVPRKNAKSLFAVSYWFGLRKM